VPHLLPLTEGAGAPVYIVHGIGGECESFRALAGLLPRPVVGVQPGPSVFASIEEAAGRYAGLIAARSAPPYDVAGYSFGGSVALEVARRLPGPVRLFVIDHVPAPVRYEPVAWTAGNAASFLANLGRWLAHQLRAGAGCRPEELLRRAARRFRRAMSLQLSSGAASVTDRQYGFDLARMAPALRERVERHYAMLRRYRPGPYPGPLVLFAAAVRPLFLPTGRHLGWERLVPAGNIRVVRVPGDHSSLLGADAPALARDWRPFLGAS